MMVITEGVGMDKGLRPRTQRLGIVGELLKSCGGENAIEVIKGADFALWAGAWYTAGERDGHASGMDLAVLKVKGIERVHVVVGG